MRKRRKENLRKIKKWLQSKEKSVPCKKTQDNGKR